MDAGNLTAERTERNDAVGRHRRERWCHRSAIQKEHGNLAPGSIGIESRCIHVLLQQHRQVLGYGVSEIRPEHADIVAPSISQPYDGLGCDLVRNAQARSKRFVVVIHVAVQADIAEAGHADGAGSIEVLDVGESAVALGIDRLREVDLPAQSVVDGQLVGCPPGVLAVKEPALLALGCIVRGSNVRDC